MLTLYWPLMFGNCRIGIIYPNPSLGLLIFKTYRTNIRVLRVRFGPLFRVGIVNRKPVSFGKGSLLFWNSCRLKTMVRKGYDCCGAYAQRSRYCFMKELGLRDVWALRTQFVDIEVFGPFGLSVHGILVMGLRLPGRFP